MTYRTMQGLGAATLTTDQIASLFKAFNQNGGCTPAFQSALAAQACIPQQFVQWFGTCYAGITPPGMSDMEFYSACQGLSKCGAFDKLGCPADAATLATMIPSCLTDAQYSEIGPVIDYCKSNPTFQGPNKSLNTACWSMSRYPDLYQKALSTPRCSTAAPAPTAPTATTSPLAPDATPTTLPTGPDDATMPAGGSQQAGMSTGKMAMIGIGGVLALGLGYMLLKKR